MTRRNSSLSYQRGAVTRMFIAALALLMLFSVGLASWRVQSFELEMARARADRQVERVTGEVERALGLGVAPYDMKFLEPALARLMSKDKSIVAAVVLDAKGERLISAGPANVVSTIKPAWVRQAMTKARSSAYSAPPRDWAASTANDPTAAVAATIWLAYDRGQIYERGRQVGITLALYALACFVGGVIVFAVIARFLRHAKSDRPALVLGSVITLLALAPLVFVARDVGRPLVASQVGISATELAENLAGQLKVATDAELPLDLVPGISTVLGDELKAATEFSFLSLAGADGKVLAEAVAGGLKTMPGGVSAASGFQNADYLSVSASTEPGALHVGYPRDSVSRKLLTLVGDLLFAVVIALVVVLEIGRGAVHIRSTDDKLASLAKLRLFVFFTALSEELLRPFFAQFASELDSPIAGLTPAWLVALPVMTFMATLALAQPFGPGLASRLELRRAMTVSCLLGGVGLILSGFVHDVVYLTVLRGLSGVAYGFALIFAQMAILRLVESRTERAGAMAQYALAIVAGGIVGPAVGSISAEVFGYPATLSVCAFAMIVGAVLALRLPSFSGASERDARTAEWASVRRFVSAGGALAVVMLAAIPARLVAAAVLLLLAPLYLIEAGERTTVVGRVLPLYFLAFYLLTRIAAEWSDRVQNRKAFVIVGALISSVACISLLAFQGVVGAAVCCLLLGVGQAIMNSPMIVLATDIATEGGRMQTEDAFASFRFLERVGSIVAAPIAAALIGVLGTYKSVIAIGLGVGVCAIFLLLAIWSYRESETRSQAATA